MGEAELNEIPGVVPALDALPMGCRFSDRCAYASDLCRREGPQLEPVEAGHMTACWHADKLEKTP